MKKYNSDIVLGTVTLNVNNLDNQLNFYTHTMGMHIISYNGTSATLGTIDNKPLLILNKVHTKFIRSYGLYHISYLVPSEQDLANILNHFVSTKVLLEGGADHGYSNAIYLSDPEGNGIEVYYDKDEKFWDKREDGRIIDITEALDAEHLLNISQPISPYQLPIGTSVGHIHLSVKNSKESSNFFQHILGFKDKFTVPNASWIAYGDYHHHLAVNNWAGPNLNLRKKGTPGLEKFDIHFIDGNTYNLVIQRIKIHNINILKETDDNITISDQNGIIINLINGIK
ncbi:glyoxalase family protein [Gemella bergeri ATCC 700627]|uniref:Glyoxalase family protein n=1 Tax=Gemella bergeri ATCC 700627 TaxID=1321820 RepID=U2Q1T6_9BACL|nr:VOC family protein [Gemella bergeri]ERK56720.1 glyoxalase family protein [Gemella bergeri ATCC 700627]